MYVDIDSFNKISIHDITTDEALELHKAIQYTFMNHPDLVIRDKMAQLAKELLENFKSACSHDKSKEI